MTSALRIGIDLGGTKIAGYALSDAGETLAVRRRPTPRFDYQGTIAAIGAVVSDLETELESVGTVGIGMPGSLSPRTGLARNGNSTWLNGRAFKRDVEAILGREVKVANDANCFALSEAVDGAGKGYACVFGVILGTGCGAGIVIDGHIHDGRHGVGGEWGHIPLPWPQPDEYPGPECWCGRRGCMETWISGPALAADHERRTGQTLDARQISERAGHGDAGAKETMDRYVDRLARGLAAVGDVLDPDIVVLGGGVSEIPDLYAPAAARVGQYLFSDYCDLPIVAAHYGPDSGGRGAAKLWTMQG
ncbi:fructokinase [Rhodoligotrophos appendicifer]|uniref:ROK family protein n=1 Tax=Rhodoligotrophos appendicifer TaxID=987056 RepID=UPI001FE9DBA3|nr:ROK family protein [Rhodoligotrophos appendicifer]